MVTLLAQLGSFLGGVNCFDEPVEMDLADALVDVYAELRTGLAALGEGRRLEAEFQDRYLVRDSLGGPCVAGARGDPRLPDWLLAKPTTVNALSGRRAG
jgi:hypothetical protein